jgi:hypothetical protein
MDHPYNADYLRILECRLMGGQPGQRLGALSSTVM